MEWCNWKRIRDTRRCVAVLQSALVAVLQSYTDALQGRKLEPRADKCIHLSTSHNKPGYRLEVLEGPRNGKLITTT
eukprot:1402273-Pleurochrysis_carterae.AAC.1